MRAEQLRAQSQALREQVAAVAEAVAEVERDVARVHEDLAEQGGPLAAQAREHANWAWEVAARERAQAQRLRKAGPSRTEDRWPGKPTGPPTSRRGSS